MTAPYSSPARLSVVVNAALIRLARAWERWDADMDIDPRAAERELEEAREVVRNMGVLDATPAEVAAARAEVERVRGTK